MNIHMMFLICLLVLAVGTSIFYNLPKKEPLIPSPTEQMIDQQRIQQEYNNLYQGPVPENCDENYFRKTGITKCKGVLE